MNVIKLQIESTDLKLISEIVISGFSDFDKKYINRSEKMVVAACETTITRTASAQMDMVVMKIHENSIHADVIGAAGGRGSHNLNYGSEESFTNDMAIRINYHCDENGIRVRKRL